MNHEQLVLHATFVALRDLIRIWGVARLGLVLTIAHFDGRMLSTTEIAVLTGMSEASVQRQLRPLLNIGRVRVEKTGRNIRYCAVSRWADKTLQVVINHTPQFDVRK